MRGESFHLGVIGKKNNGGKEKIKVERWLRTVDKGPIKQGPRRDQVRPKGGTKKGLFFRKAGSRNEAIRLLR